MSQLLLLFDRENNYRVIAKRILVDDGRRDPFQDQRSLAISPNFSTDGLELRYEAELGQEGEPHCVRQQVFRDENGNYFLAIKGGTNGVMLSLETTYQFSEPEVLFPIRPEALARWAAINLCGEDCRRAQEEFKNPEFTSSETVWLFQQGSIHAVPPSLQKSFPCRAGTFQCF